MFFSSAAYWDRRYRSGGNSGPGSYAHLASFKAQVLNDFVERHGVRTVIEFGCGDGNQLSLARYLNYHGYDVSPMAVDMCRRKFAAEANKQFDLVSAHRGESAELSLSLDVIFHLVEDAVFDDYMNRLFKASKSYVGIYSSNTDAEPIPRTPHVRHRKFSDWIATNVPEWSLIERVPNRFPDDGDNQNTSFSEFFFYELSHHR
jgi:hypothetical protein